MLAVYITKPGKPEVVQIRETDRPALKAGQVMVKVKATGLNYAEIVVRRGLYPDAPKFPFISGYEYSGIVEDDNNCGIFQKGDRVLGVAMFGAQAQYIAANPLQLFKIPDSMSFDLAAALPVNYLTAYYALVRFAGLRDNETVLIHSCAGGVGTAASQLAKERNAVVFGTTSSDDKVKYLENIGIDYPVNYRQSDYSRKVDEITNGKGVDIVLDPVGGPNFRKSFKLLKSGGRIVSYGVADLTAGGRFNLPRLIWKFLTIPSVRTLNLIQSNRGVYGLALNRLLDNADEVGMVIKELLGKFENGSIKPVISRVFDFKEVASAHEFLESGKSTGKIVLNFED